MTDCITACSLASVCTATVLEQLSASLLTLDSLSVSVMTPHRSPPGICTAQKGCGSCPQSTGGQLRQSSDLWEPALHSQHQCPSSLIPSPHLVVHWVAACSRGVTALTSSRVDAVLAAPEHESAKACTLAESIPQARAVSAAPLLTCCMQRDHRLAVPSLWAWPVLIEMQDIWWAKAIICNGSHA